MTCKSLELVTYLQRWKDDRGALATLRCALRPALRSRTWPLMAQLTRLDSTLLPAYETVAGLWASDADSHRAGAGNFGVVCRALRNDHETFDVRFRRLIDCDTRKELCERIAPVCLAAQVKESRSITTNCSATCGSTQARESSAFASTGLNPTGNLNLKPRPLLNHENCYYRDAV
jgi:hypothetical protein